MGTLTQLVNDLRASSDKSRGGVQKAINSIKRKIVTELQAHSPYDTGEFQSNWRASLLRFGQAGSLGGLSITNITPMYAEFMELGAPVKGPPWYYPKKSGSSGTGKLIESGGRIWAGGKNPGHDKTIGGAINQVLVKKDLWDSFTLDVSDEFIKAFI